MKQTPKSWRNPIYISQIPESAKKDSRPQSALKKFTCYICTDRNNGISTTGIMFANGKVFVGADVWRMSNPADCCDYPFRRYKNMAMAEKQYEFKIVDQSVLTILTKEGDRYVYE